VKPESIIEAMEWMDDDLINELTPKIIQKWPNTYTFTKNIAEYLVLQETKTWDIPCSIVRPSIICAAWREPLPGWIDNFNGPTALFPACGSGLLRTMIGHRDAVADVIPVDMPVNLIIATGWFVGKSKSKNLLVYNCTSGQINRITWGEMETMMKPKIFEYPFDNIVMYPDPHFTPHRAVKVVRTFFEQLVPAYVMDFFIKFFDKKNTFSFVRIQKKITKSINALEFFTTREWEFTNDNLFMLRNQLNSTDCRVSSFFYDHRF
jgi:fatty acyl-CoA reductase